MGNNTINTFIKGIKSDTAPVDASNLAATDIVNGELLTDNGNQMILQPAKSNVPVYGYGEYYETQYFYVDMPDENGNYNPVVIDPTKKLHTIFFTLGPQGQADFGSLTFTLNYGNDITEEVGPFGAEMFEQPGSGVETYSGTYFLYAYDQKNPLKSINFTTQMGGMVELYYTLYYYTEKNVRLDKNEKILGVKEYNDVAYIVSAHPLTEYYNETISNNHAEKAYDTMDLGNILDDRDKPSSTDTVKLLSGSSSKEKTNKLLHDVNHTSFRDSLRKVTWYYAGNFLTTDPLIDIIKLDKAGKYTIKFTLKFYADSYASNLNHHSAWVQFFLNEEINSITSEISNNADYKSSSEPIIIERSLPIETTTDGEIIKIRYKQTVCDNGKISYKGTIETQIIDAPEETITIPTISIDSITTTPAYSNLFTNGTIFIKKTEEHDNGDFSFYQVALEKRDWHTITEGEGYTFTNLASGIYNLYVKKNDTIIKKSIFVPEKFKTENTGVRAIITDFNNYSFHLKLIPYDYDYEQGDGYKKYSGTYKVGYYNEITPEIINEQVINLYETAEFDVILDGPGIIMTYCEPSAPSVDEIDNLTSALTRKAVLEVPITESMNNSTYGIRVGTFPAPEDYNVGEGKLIDVYKPLNNLDYSSFNTNKISISDKNYLDVEIQPSYDNSVNIIFTDKNSDIRIVNSGFAVLPGGNYELLDSSQNQYQSKNVDIKTKLMQVSGSIPKMDVVSINNSMGKLEPGTYKYFIKLSTEDGNETDIIEETGFIPVFFGSTMGDARGGKSTEQTTKSISLHISKINNSYKYVSLLYLINTGDKVNTSRAFKVLKKYRLNNGVETESDITILHTGFEEKQEIPVSELSLKYDHIKSSKTITQIQNRLFIANLGSDNIDYHKLFKASEKILALPTKKISDIDIGEVIYNRWNSEYSDLENISDEYFSQKIETERGLGDINDKSSNVNQIDLFNILTSQGFHNPLLAEKLTGYWPYETYKTGICFVMDNDQVTNPVPISSTDYLEYSSKNEEQIVNSFSNIEFKDQENWVSDPVNDLDFNNIGIIRFPEMKSPTTIYYPKFQFSKKELIKQYPDFFSRVKGFFFVRAERKENIILTGAILNCSKMVTNPNNIQDFTNKDGYREVPVFDGSEDISDVSVVPIPVFNNDADGGYKIIVGIETFSTPDGDGNVELQSGEIQDYGVISSWLSRFSRNGMDNYKYAVYSGDLVADTARAVASFNGTKFGLLGLNKFYVNEYTKVFEKSVYEKLITLNSSLNLDKEGTINKVVTDYIPAGKSSRSGGGFASKIPFKSSKIILNDNGVDSYYFPTGVYESFMGISVSGEVVQNFGIMFSDINGPLTHDALMQQYSIDESTLYVPITRRYSFDEFSNDEIIKVVGTRGDCFISQNVFSIVNAEPTIVGGVTSTRDTLKDVSSGTDEYNSYRAKDFAISMLFAHQTNYLSFLRSLDVHDVQETAEFGKPRGFLPYDSNSEKLLVKTHANRIVESSAFNKGYKFYFEGRKYASVSKNNVYIAAKDENDIMFSDIYTNGQYQNGYRNFNSLNVFNYNKELGAINKIISLANNLIIVHTKGVTRLPVNESTLVQNSNGADINIRSVNVLPERSTPLSEIYGSIYPESICKTDNAIYGVDTLKKKIWMTKGGQLKIISDDGINRILSGFLFDFLNKENVPGELYVKTFHNKRSNQVIFSFYNKESRFLSRAIEMDIDLYYFLYPMTDLGRNGWIDSATTKEEKAERKKQVEYFKNIYLYSQPVKFLTIVFNEMLQTWETRYNFTPEFGFNINGSFYSINNLETSKGFTSNIFSDDTDRHLIWKHGGTHWSLPVYGSYYGNDPVFEVEYISNQNPKNKKTFHTINIIGTEAKPSKVIYQISPQCPWFQVLLDRYPDGVGTLNDEQIREKYYDLIVSNGYPLNNGAMQVVNPNIYILQDIYDRRNTTISKANYNYVKGYNKVIINKNLKSLYFTNEWQTIIQKNKGMRFKDVYLKVRFVYNLGNYLYIKAIETLFDY